MMDMEGVEDTIRCEDCGSRNLDLMTSEGK